MDIKGSDIYKDIQFVGTDDSAIPIDSLVDYKIEVYSELDSCILTFSKTPGEDEESIEVIDNDNGDIRIKFDRDWTTDAQSSKYYCDVYWYTDKTGAIDDMDLTVIKKTLILEFNE